MKDFIGDGVQIIGAGKSPIGVLAIYFDAGGDNQVARPKDGWVRSTDLSRFLWIEKRSNAFSVRVYDYDDLHRVGAALALDKAVAGELARAESRDLFLKMTEKAVREAQDQQTKDQIHDLQKNATEALKKLDEINRKLSDELDRAQQLSALSASLAGMSGILNLAGQIAMVRSRLGARTPEAILQATTQAQFDSALTAAQDQGQQVIQATQQSQTIQYNNYIHHRTDLVIQLGSQHAPEIPVLRP